MFKFHNNQIYFSALIKSVSTLIKFSLYTSYLLYIQESKYEEKRVNNFLNNVEQKIILCKTLEIVYAKNCEQFLWENVNSFN